MRKLGFTLIELLVVIVLIGVISFLVIKLPSMSKNGSLTDLREALLPDGSVTVFKNGAVEGKVKINLPCDNPVTYVFKNGEFEKKEYNESVVFKYSVKNGIGESFILECGGFYVFKPLFVKKAETMKKAQELFTNKDYKPSYGSYY